MPAHASRAVLAFLLLLSLPLVARTSPLPTTMFRGNPAHTGTMRAQSAVAIDAVKFSFSTGGPIRGGAVSDGKTVFFGSEDHAVYALRADTGTQRWRTMTDGAVTSTPAVADGRVYATSRDGQLYCLDAADGRVLWRLQFGADLGPMNYWD
jgi:outer membrane protein assembly factor BamB